MTTNYLRPAANGRLWKWSQGEPATGLPWVPPDKEPKVRKKSNEKYAVCVGGPLHNSKLRRSVKQGSGKAARTIPVLPERFRVPPYAGFYLLNRESDTYRWTTRRDER